MMCGDPRLFTGSTGIFLKSSEAFFFFLNLRLWGNLEAQDLNGI